MFKEAELLLRLCVHLLQVLFKVLLLSLLEAGLGHGVVPRRALWQGQLLICTHRHIHTHTKERDRERWDQCTSEWKPEGGSVISLYVCLCSHVHAYTHARVCVCACVCMCVLVCACVSESIS